MTSENPRETGPAGETGPEGPRGPAGPYMTEGARKAFHALLKAIAVLFVVSFAIGAGNLLFTNSQVHAVRDAQYQADRNSAALQRELRADCNWYRDVSALPVVNPPMGRPSIIVPRLISDSRATWTGRGCPGTLPPPDPSFVKWAKFYHLPVS